MSDQNNDSKNRLEIYKKLLLVRESEWQMTRLYKRGELDGHVLPCLGQEAIPAAFSHILKPEDVVLTGHRGGGHYIARGGDLKKLWAELYGTVNGIHGGKAGQIHLADMGVNTVAGNAIVGANWVLGCGAGFALKQENKGMVAAVFGGEASTNRGTFHEALNMASLKKLPIVFVVEFNGKQLWDDNDKVTAVKELSDRAKAYDMPGLSCDGNDPDTIIHDAQGFIKKARNGQGPSLLVCKTFKWYDSGTNQRQTDEELQRGRAKFDPVKLYAQKLMSEGILSEEIDQELRDLTSQTIAEAVKFGKNGPLPVSKDAYTHVYAADAFNQREDY